MYGCCELMSFCKFPFSALGKRRQTEKKFYFGTRKKEAFLQKARKYVDS